MINPNLLAHMLFVSLILEYSQKIVLFLSFGKAQKTNLSLRSSLQFYTKLLETAM